MLKGKSKRKRKHDQVYGQLPIWLRVLAFCFSLFLPFVIIVSIVSIFSSIGQVSFIELIVIAIAVMGLVAVSVFGIWRLYGLVFHNYIRINDEGIDYYFCGVMGFACWDELAYISYRTYLDDNHIWGILTTRTTAYWHGYFTEKFGYSRYFKGMIPLSLMGNIPLPRGFMGTSDVNLRKFKETPFGKELYLHAPQLFEEEKAKNRDD